MQGLENAASDQRIWERTQAPAETLRSTLQHFAKLVSGTYVHFSTQALAGVWALREQV